MPEWEEHQKIVLGSLNSGEAALDVMAHFFGGWCGEYSKLTRRWAPNERENSMEETLAIPLQNLVSLILCASFMLHVGLPDGLNINPFSFCLEFGKKMAHRENLPQLCVIFGVYGKNQGREKKK
jgi:hypothetical protein